MKKIRLLIGAIIVSCFVYGHYKNCVRWENNVWCQNTARGYCLPGSAGFKNCVKYENNPWCRYKARAYCQSCGDAENFSYCDKCQRTAPFKPGFVMHATEKPFCEVLPDFLSAQKEEKKDKYYWSPLFWAVALADYAELKRLLNALEQHYGSDKRGLLAELNKQDWAGRTLLYLAVEWIRKDVVNILIKYAVKWFGNDQELFFEWITKPEFLITWSPLHGAMYSSFSPAVHDLVEVAQRVFGKESALLEKFINQKDAFGRTPLAVGIEPWDRIYVYNHGGEEIQSPGLNTERHLKLQKALLRASSLMGYPDELKRVLDLGLQEAALAEKLPHTKKLMDVLTSAQEEYEHKNKYFLDFITARNGAGWTALMNAAVDGNSVYVDLILSAANKFFAHDKVWVAFVMNTCDVHGRTVWHLAISRRHVDIVKTLIKAQKEIAGNRKQPFLRIMTHRTELNGFSPLHVAVYESADDIDTFHIVKMMLERASEVLGVGSREFDAFINMKDYDGFTALDYATGNRINALLKKYGAT
jgi:ankyrin repeat protein